MIRISNIKKIISGIIILLSVITAYSQVSDIDNNVYKTIIIGGQEWMAENLNVSHFNNGDEINKPQGYDNHYWHYKDQPKNGKIYGKLYDWYAVTDSRGLAPEGWHVATEEDWKELISFLGGSEIAGNKLKTTDLWESSEIDEITTNESGFTALPGGYRFISGTYEYGQYESIQIGGYFWTSSPNNDEWNGRNKYATSYCMFYNVSNVERRRSFANNGFSVRCVKNRTSPNRAN